MFMRKKPALIFKEFRVKAYLHGYERRKTSPQESSQAIMHSPRPMGVEEYTATNDSAKTPARIAENAANPFE